MPEYDVNIPSIHDGLMLNCRLFIPRIDDTLGDFIHDESLKRRGFRGAIIAHPHPGMGGDQSHSVVVESADTLRLKGYFVLTFNFRGAGKSPGKSSWTGRAELDDYISAFGFLTYYLDELSAPEDPFALSPVVSATDPNFNPDQPFVAPPRRRFSNLVLLAGYSFGSLVLSRLPAVDKLVERFTTAAADSNAEKIASRARQLAAADQRTIDQAASPRGARMHSGAFQTPEKRLAPVTIGGADANPSNRPRSREARRSGEMVRNVISHVHRRSSSSTSNHENQAPATTVSLTLSGPTIRVAYMLIAPVIIPFTSAIAPTKLFQLFDHHEPSGLLSFTGPVLIAYGDSDTWTREADFEKFVHRLTKANQLVRWERISQADHFFQRGSGQRLQNAIDAWLKDEEAGPC